MNGIRSNWVVWIILGMLIYHLWRPVVCQATAFTDLQGHWGKADIEQMVLQKIAAGYPDGKFRPEQPISRAEFAVLLSRAMPDHPVSSDKGYSFADVKPQDWFYPDIMRLARAGIIRGDGSGLFHPQKTIQRQEAAQMLWSCMLIQGLASELEDSIVFQFSDEQNISGWAHMAVKALTRQKVFCGYPDQCFHPTHPMTRAQACLVLNRAIILLKSRDNSLPVMQPGAFLPRTSGGTSSDSWLPSTPPNAPDGLTSNYLHCRVRVIN